MSQEPRAPRRLDGRAMAAAGLLLLALVVAAVAARGASWTSRGPTAWHAPRPVRPVALPTQTPRPPQIDPSANLPPSQASGDVMLVILVLLAFALLFVLVRGAVCLRWLVHRAAPAAPLAPLDDRPLAEAAERALVEVEQPDTREAVVRAWLLLGAAAAESDLPADPAETATEYAQRIATAFAVPVAQLHRLAELYREARFSTHTVEEIQRTEARELLQRLRAGLEEARV